MPTIRTDADAMDWAPANEFYGPQALYRGKPVFEIKLLCDRRGAGGGVAYLLRITPPEGKVVKIVAVARSDEHVFGLRGGAGTKTGGPRRFGGNYSLNPEGQPHSAFIGEETVSLVVYTGEPDEIRAIEFVDREAAA